LAADIEPFYNNIELIDILNWIHNNLEYKELIAEYFPAGWIHISYQKGNNKKILKLKDRYNNYAVVDIDYINGMSLGNCLNSVFLNCLRDKKVLPSFVFRG